MRTSGSARLWLVALSSLSIGSPAAAQSYDFTAARELLEQNLDAFTGGVFVQVFQGDREIFAFQSGDVRADTVLRLASASKWLSAAVILRLAGDGALDLDGRIGDALPIFDLYGKGGVTPRQAFGMTSGLHETAVDYETSPWITLARAADLIAAGSPIVFPPGTQLDYEGDGMQAVGRVAEVVSGIDWRSLADQELATPLGLANLDYGLLPVNPCVPGGARVSPAEYQEFLRMILVGGRARDGSTFLSPEALEVWFTNQTLGLPEFSSPWPPFPYPYGQRPDYGFGAWILAHEPVRGQVEEVASPGKFGTLPWVDRKRHLRGIVATDSANGFSDAVFVELTLLARLRDAIDAVLVFTDGFERGTTLAWSLSSFGDR